MAENKTQPTEVRVADFLSSVPERRQREAQVLIALYRGITGHEPVMWGPSVIGFGKYHYRYASGREGDAGAAGFSPRKARLTIYIPEGFTQHADLLAKLGKHSTSVSCLYINKLEDIDLGVLRDLLSRSFTTMTTLAGDRAAGRVQP